jgi:ribonuclease HII
MPHGSLISWQVEEDLWQQGYALVAGIDEAGRGALAGPVVAAAVICHPSNPLAGVEDSKRLSAAARADLCEMIQCTALGIGVGFIDAQMIDRVNIRQATLLAMQAAVRNLVRPPDFLLIDGRDRVPALQRQRSVVHGDQTVGSIAAASIIAKVSRDRYMEILDRQYQGYGFAQHKGYGTTAHYRAIRQLGPSILHRVSFRGVVLTASPND